MSWDQWPSHETTNLPKLALSQGQPATQRRCRTELGAFPGRLSAKAHRAAVLRAPDASQSRGCVARLIDESDRRSRPRPTTKPARKRVSAAKFENAVGLPHQRGDSLTWSFEK